MPKKIFARISIELEVPDELYNEFYERSRTRYSSDDKPPKVNYETYEDVSLTNKEAKMFLENGTLADDSYIPSTVIEDLEYFEKGKKKK